MFSKQFRLPATIVLQDPKHSQNSYFSVKVGKNDLLYNRYGFVVGKQVDKRATIRNSIKRKIRAYFEEHNSRFKQGFDILVVIKKPALDATMENLRKVIEKSLQEAGMV